MLNAILNLVFPADCVVCDQPITEWSSGAVCTRCANQLEPTSAPFCQQCGSTQSVDESDTDGSTPCRLCRAGLTRYGLGRSALAFDETLRAAIHHFKYNDRVSLARPFGRAMRECFDSAPFTATRVVPVPLHRTRTRHRGYNQALLLALRLGLEVEAGLTRRVRPTATQTGLSRNQRIENVRNAFECRGPVKGSYLIVDDVMTTGATINEVARMLLKNGASRVEVLTLTRVQHH